MSRSLDHFWCFVFDFFPGAVEWEGAESPPVPGATLRVLNLPRSGLALLKFGDFLGIISGIFGGIFFLLLFLGIFSGFFWGFLPLLLGVAVAQGWDVTLALELSLSQLCQAWDFISLLPTDAEGALSQHQSLFHGPVLVVALLAQRVGAASLRSSQSFPFFALP